MSIDVKDILVQALEARKRSTRFPRRWRPEEGDTIVGEVTDIATNPFNQEKQQVAVRSIKDGEEYLLPSNVALNRALLGQGVKVGDYVLVRYAGKSDKPTKRGFYAKMYEVAVMPKEEALKILSGQVLTTPQVTPRQTVDREPLRSDRGVSRQIIPRQPSRSDQVTSSTSQEPLRQTSGYVLPPQESTITEGGREGIATRTETVEKVQEAVERVHDVVEKSLDREGTRSNPDLTRPPSDNIMTEIENLFEEKPQEPFSISRELSRQEPSRKPETKEATEPVKTEGPKEDSEKLVKAKAFIGSVMDFYGKIHKDDLLRLLNEVQGFSLSLEEIIKLGGLKQEGDYLSAA